MEETKIANKLVDLTEQSDFEADVSDNVSDRDESSHSATSPVVDVIKKVPKLKVPKKKWTEMETEALIKGMLKYEHSNLSKPWVTIKEDPEFSTILKDRTPVNLKDKHRNLAEKMEKEEQMSKREDGDEENITERQFEIFSDREQSSNTLREVGDEKRVVQRRRVSQKEREFIWKSLSGLCYLCKTYIPKLSSWHIEHVVAFSSNPKVTDVLGNMLPACQGCNQTKGKKSLTEIADDFTFDISTRAKDVTYLNTGARNAIIRALDIKHSRSTQELLPVEIVEQAMNSTILSIKQRIEMEKEVSVCDFSLEEVAKENIFDIDEDPISHGSFGEVYSAKFRDCTTSEHIEVALKVPRFGNKKMIIESFCREADFYSRLGRHEFIVSFIGYSTQLALPGETGASLALILEYCPFSLERQICMKNVDGIAIISQVLSAVNYIHSFGLVHRDIKPGNILIQKRSGQSWKEAYAKLCDLGSSKLIDLEDKAKNSLRVGTAGFRPPEARSGEYSQKTDVFSIGKTMKQIQTENSSLQSPDIMKGWKECWKDMVLTDVSKRPTLTDAREMFKQKFNDLGYNFESIKSIESSTPNLILEEISAEFDACLSIDDMKQMIVEIGDRAPRATLTPPPLPATGKSHDNSRVRGDNEKSEGVEVFVYLIASARCLENITGCKRMKYHTKRDCKYLRAYRAAIHCVSSSEAESFQHSKCELCEK